jgi:uncharacterized protein (UPF0335 family)
MTATAGHNSKGISEEDKDVLLAIHTRKIMAAREAAKKASDLVKTLEKDVKNDGFDAKEIRDYLDVMLSDDQQKHVKKFNMMERNRVKLGVIPPRGKDLFDDRATREQQIDADGYETGINGLERKPRHTRGGSEDTVWYGGYDRGRKKYDQRYEVVLAAMEAARAAEAAAKSNEEPPATGDDPFGDDA